MAQQQDAFIHTHWNFDGDGRYWNYEQDLWIGTVASGTYWALSWNWSGSNVGGYMGLQYHEDGKSVALFSLWDKGGNHSPVNGINNGDQSVECKRFGGEGTGWTCQRPAFPKLSTDRYYRFRVCRLDHTDATDKIPAANRNDAWWGAWIYDLQTGERYDLGLIHAPTGGLLLGPPINFVEYFGTSVAKPTDVPTSVAYWARPAANVVDRSELAYEAYAALDAERTRAGDGVRVGHEQWSFPSVHGQRVVVGGDATVPQGNDQPPSSHPHFDVKFAAWGALKTSPGGEMRIADVTDTLRTKLNMSNNGSATIDTEGFGDPAEGSQKHFGAIVSIDGGSGLPFACVEGQTIQFAAPPNGWPTTRYVVKAAAYGSLQSGSAHDSTAARDVTYALQESLNSSIDGSVTIDKEALQSLPSISEKHLGALVEVDGSQRWFACVDGQTIDFSR